MQENPTNTHTLITEYPENKITTLRIKITHMWRRRGTPWNFFLAFIDELEKQIIIKKTVEVGH